MGFDPEGCRQNSLRLRGYDYGSAGIYFVTICVEERNPLFGEIADGILTPSEAGSMVESWWGNLMLHFSGIDLGAYVVMPNHFHGLISLGVDPSLGVGVARRGHPAAEGAATEHRRASLSDLVGWYKSITTNDYGKGVRQYGWPPYAKRLWQRGFYEHIVRNDHDLARIEEYIDANPARWEMDELHAG